MTQADFDPNSFTVEHGERFSLATAGEYVASPELNVTGVVSPDVSRQVPVPSLASGRVVEIDARLGDVVSKGSSCSRSAARTLRERFPITARRSRTRN